MSELESFTAANRFGLGAHPANVGRISPDPRGWLTRQIEQPDSFQLNAPSLPGRPQVAQALATFLIAQRERMNSGPSNLTAAEQVAAVGVPLRALNQIAAEEILVRTRHGLQTDWFISGPIISLSLRPKRPPSLGWGFTSAKSFAPISPGVLATC